VEGEEDLGGVRGYKKRADGSTTTYFDRQVDAETRRMLDELKAPKKLDAAAAPAAEEAARRRQVGSAWNSGTWEDKDMSAWASAELKSRLAAVRAELPPSYESVLHGAAAGDMGGGSSGALDALTAMREGLEAAGAVAAKVREVKTCDGTATLTASRGALRHAMDFSLELPFSVALTPPPKVEGEAAGKPHTYKGTASYADVTCAVGGGGALDVGVKWDKTVAAAHAPRVEAALEQLKDAVRAALVEFVAEFKRKEM